MTVDRPAAAGTVRARAVQRALRAASARAAARVDRFVAAAFELLDERSPCTDFSVQDVVDRSGQSLRSFYGCYRGRHDLLLAMLEEAVRSTCSQLAAQAAREPDALARLRIIVVALHRSCCWPAGRAASKKGRRLPPELVLELSRTDPDATSRILEPLVAQLDAVLAEATAAGCVRALRRRRDMAATITQIVIFDEFSRVIAPAAASGVDRAEEVWGAIQGGLTGSSHQGGGCRG